MKRDRGGQDSPMSSALRRVPQKRRGEQRVSELLGAAASLIAEFGVDAVSMNAIAERAGASIGSLYQFFPNKEGVLVTLRQEYALAYDALWAKLELRAATLSIPHFVDLMLDLLTEFFRERPAALALYNPVAFTGRHQEVRGTIARVLTIRHPRMSVVKARRMAGVLERIVFGLHTEFKASGENDHEAMREEFRTLLIAYLKARLKEPVGSA